MIVPFRLRIKPFYGNFGINVRRTAIFKTMGAEGLTRVSREAVLNANYMFARLKERSMSRMTRIVNMSLSYPENVKKRLRTYA